ncbi:MAG: tetratricopeptide repeat protein [Planctomyces sp.]|nr:tetratricopeptide repeat protein [Planctomyces sp.]
MEELFESDLAEISQLMNEARSLSNAAKTQSAIILYRQVLSRNPFHTEALNELAELLETAGETDEAKRYRQRIIILQPMKNQHGTPRHDET